MGRRGERKDRREPRPPSADRACLLLSLILLVWNIGTACTQSFSSRHPPGEAESLKDPAPPAPPGGSGPLTLKQKFLLGKKIDLNRATFEEINTLPGISDRVARELVEERKRRGGFRSPEEILAVRGIKEKRLKKILPFLAEFDNN